MSKKRDMKPYRLMFLSVFCLVLLLPVRMGGEEDRTGELMRKADSLRMEYRFGEAVAAYREAIASTADSVARLEIAERLLLAENGENMAGFVSDPVVVARHRFHIDDFFLYYPLADSSWVAVPNQLDTLGQNRFSRASYVPQGSDEIYFSAPDASGAMNIYRTEDRDTVWSLPILLNEDMVSSSDEIYPMLSKDGKTLFFASSGLYGVGGYDIYKSSWDEAKGEWGVPVNMGFPYSSPYNDFLYIDTDDGKYTIFASDRYCPADSVDVFVLEYDNMPVRKEFTDMDALCRLCRLDPEDGLDGGASSHDDHIPENVDTRRYADKVAEMPEPNYFLTVTRSKFGNVLGEGTIESFSVYDFRENPDDPAVYTCEGIDSTPLAEGKNVFNIPTVEPDRCSYSPVQWINTLTGQPVAAPFVFRTADGKYAKVRFSDYDRENGTIRIRYVYAADGSHNLK